MTRCYGGRDEELEGGRDVRAVFSDGEDVIKWWEAFFHYVWYGIEYCSYQLGLFVRDLVIRDSRTFGWPPRLQLAMVHAVYIISLVMDNLEV